MKAQKFLLIFTLTFLVAFSCASAVTKVDLLKALDDALMDGSVDSYEKTYLLGLLDNYLATITTDSEGVDLIIDSIITEPASPVPGDYITFNVVVKNIGTKEVWMGTSEVKLYIDNTLTASQKYGIRILPGETATYVFDADVIGKEITFATPGTHEIKAEVDANNVILEKSDSNNVLIRRMIMGPDLIIEDISLSPSPLRTGIDEQMSVKIKNKGNQKAEGEIQLNSNDEENSVGESRNIAIEPGATFTWISNSKRVYLKASTYTIKATVDYTNKIAESDEGNNNFEKKVAVVYEANTKVVNLEQANNLFPVDAWECTYKTCPQWTDCSKQDGGWTGADKICKYLGYTGAASSSQSPCYQEYVSDSRWKLGFTDDGTPVKGEFTKQGAAFTKVICKT